MISLVPIRSSGTRFIVEAAAYPNKGIQIEGTFLNFNMGCIDNPWYFRFIPDEEQFPLYVE